MADKNLDKIYIKDLAIRCIIGINDNERREKQDIIINIVLFADMHKACETDNIDDAVDYKVIKKKIIAFVEKSSYFLIEKLAEEISKICLEHKNVKKTTVKVDKPQALRFARSVAVKITRYQK